MQIPKVRVRFGLLSLLLVTLLVASVSALVMRWGPWIEIATIRLAEAEGGLAHSNALFNVNGSRFITADQFGHIQIWNSASGALEQDLPWHTTGDLTLSPRGSEILCAGSENGVWTIHLWDLVSKTDQSFADEPAPTGRSPWSMNLPRFSHDGKQLLVGLEYGAVRIYDLTAHTRSEWRAHNGSIRDAIFSYDSSYVVTGGADHFAVMWDVASQKELFRVEHPDEVMHCFLSPNDDKLLTNCYGPRAVTTQLWDVKSKTRLAHESGWVNLKTGSQFSRGASWFCTGGQTLRIFDSITGVQLHQTDRIFPGDVALRAPELSDDASRVLCAGASGQQRLLDASSGAFVATLELLPSGGMMDVHHFNAGMVATSDTNKEVHLWRTEDGVLLDSLRHASRVDYVEIDINGQRCLTKTEDQRVHIWERNRPESLRGVVWLPEFWITVLLAGAFFRNLWRGRVPKVS